MTKGSIEIFQHTILQDRLDLHLVEAKINWPNGATSSGWGRSADGALAATKSVAEAFERHAYRTLGAVSLASAAELGSPFIDPDLLIQYDAAQYDADGFPFTRFHFAQPRLWSRAKSVVQGKEFSVLADLLWNPRAFPDEYRQTLVTHASSSGWASGTSLDDAILRAVLETLERDAFMRHWLTQTPGHDIPLNGLPGATGSRFAALVELGCRVGLQYLHLGKHPTWLVWAQHPGLHFTCIGTGCALSADEALDTALCELEVAATARALGVAPVSILERDVRSPEDHAALYSTQAYFQRADDVLQRGVLGRFAALAPHFERSASNLYEHLHSQCATPYFIDASMPEAVHPFTGASIHTVKVVIPTTVPLTFGFGRLPLGMTRHRRSHWPVHPFA